MKAHQAQQAIADPDELRYLSLDIIAVTNLTDDILIGASAQMRAEACSKLLSVRLDDLQLQYLPVTVLEHLRCCKRLYLQHNCLSTCSTLAVLPQLTMLVLSHNQLKQVHGLRTLANLLFLDLSFNLIQQLDGSQLPASTKYLNVAGNPLSNRPGLLQQLAEHVPQLKELDGIPVSSTDAATATALVATPENKSSMQHVQPHTEQHNGSDDHATPGQDAAATISRHLVGLQQLEQQYTARAAAACRCTLLSSNRSSWSGMQPDTAEEVMATSAPAPATPRGEASSVLKVAEVRSSQQLAARIVLTHSSTASAVLQHNLPAASHASQEVPPCMPGCSTFDQQGSQQTETAILRKSFSITVGRATDHNNIPSSRQSALQHKGPKLLSRPQSAGAAVYVPVQPKLGCHQQPVVVTHTPTSSHECGSQDQSLAASASRSSVCKAAAAMASSQHVPLAAAVASCVDKSSSIAKQGGQPRASRINTSQVQSPGGKVPAAKQAGLQSTTAATASPGTVSRPWSGAQESVYKKSVRQISQSISTSRQVSSSSSSSRRSNSNQEHNKQPSDSSSTHQQVSNIGSQKACSAIKRSGSSAGACASAEAFAKTRCASQQTRPTPSAAAALSSPAAEVVASKHSSHPRRLPSLKAAADCAAAGEAAPSSAKERTSGQPEELVNVLSRPVSAAGKLAPVQHPALAPAYEQRCSSSRPSTTSTTNSGSAICSSHCSRAGSAEGSIKAKAGLQACLGMPNGTKTSSNSSGVSQLVNVGSLVHDRCELLQGCVATSASVSSVLSTVPSTAALQGSGADSNPAAMLNALATDSKEAISSVAQAIRQRAKQRLQQLRQQQEEQLLMQRQQLVTTVPQLKKQASNHLHGRTMLTGEASVMEGALPAAGASTTAHRGAAGDVATATRAKPVLLTAALTAQQGSCVAPSELAAAVVSRVDQLKERMAAAQQQLQDEAVQQPLARQNSANEGVGQPLKEAYGLAYPACSNDSSSSSKYFTAGDFDGCDMQSHTQCAGAAVVAGAGHLSYESRVSQLDSELDADSDLQSMIAKMFGPVKLPDFSMDGLHHAAACHDSVKSGIAQSLFKLSLPPGL